DVVFVHAKAQEEKFVADGFGVKRFAVMYNDFVLIGPKSDPAGVRGMHIGTALKAIRDKGTPFVSRGDKSGTHSAELALWKGAGIDPHPNPPPHSPSKTGVNALSLGEGREGVGPWYREIGQGMGAALNTASSMNGYTLADRGTWLAFKNRGELDIAVEGDKRLLNQYGVMLVNPDKHPHVKNEFGQQFIDWLVSAEGQKAIADYRIDGQQLFFPNASVPGA
ncbi:MAG: substrate-binding domain-containing protein, partial [Casimicrobiaceae bacterium]